MYSIGRTEKVDGLGSVYRVTSILWACEGDVEMEGCLVDGREAGNSINTISDAEKGIANMSSCREVVVLRLLS